MMSQRRGKALMWGADDVKSFKRKGKKQMSGHKMANLQELTSVLMFQTLQGKAPPVN
jgi:hypothetical protein